MKTDLKTLLKYCDYKSSIKMNGHSQQLKIFTANIWSCQLLYHSLKAVISALFPIFG